MKKLITVAVVLAVATLAQADLILNVVEVTAAKHTSRGMRAFDLSWVGAAAGDEFVAFEGLITGNIVQVVADFGAGPAGMTVNQQAFVAYGKFPGSDPVDLDTHFSPNIDLGTGVGLWGSKPTEDLGASGPIEVDIDGFFDVYVGTTIAKLDETSPPDLVIPIEVFAVAIPDEHQALVTPLGHFVTMGNINISGIAVRKGAPDTGIDIDVDIPEPTAMILVVLGAVGVIAKRRRTA